MLIILSFPTSGESAPLCSPLAWLPSERSPPYCQRCCVLAPQSSPADCGTVLLTTPGGGCCANRGRKRSRCSVSGIASSWESQVLLIPLRKEGGEGEKKMLILTFFNLLLSIYGEGLLCGAACFYCFIAPLCHGVNK